jgi:beta-glucosidase
MFSIQSGVLANLTIAQAAANFLNTTWFADPMFLGHYPEDGLALFEEAMPPVSEEDMRTIHQPLDFYGVNMYHGHVVGAAGDPPPPDGQAITAMEWSVVPETLYWGPRFLYERYRLPIVVAENGMANLDWVHQDGQVHDPQRIDFLARYLAQLGRAADDGVDIKGYFHWSATDNFEWAYGFRRRFGFIFIDFTTGERILKDSAYWYRDLIATNGAEL